MHELAIVEGIIDAAVPEAKKHGAKRILVINLKIGELSGVIPECIQEYFTSAAAGSIAENAKIAVERVPATIRCNSCGYDGALGKRRRRCPNCEGTDFILTGGREYFVDSLEVE